MNRVPTVTFKAACRRGACGWILSGLDHSKVVGDFLRHLEQKHHEYPPGTIGIAELGCDSNEMSDDEDEMLGQLFEED